MKKRSVIIAILLVLSIVILILDTMSMEERRSYYAKDIDFTSESQLIAIAYLEDIYDSSKMYINSLDNIKIYELSGDETYLIIPRYDKVEINIYEAILEEDKLVKDNLVATGDLPFIVTCNNSEWSNVILEVKYDDIVFEYSPSLNEEGININKYIFDMTK